eukprot:6174755-Pleurochrysis_carterae.AAC.1
MQKGWIDHCGKSRSSSSCTEPAHRSVARQREWLQTCTLQTSSRCYMHLGPLAHTIHRAACSPNGGAAAGAMGRTLPLRYPHMPDLLPTESALRVEVSSAGKRRQCLHRDWFLRLASTNLHRAHNCHSTIDACNTNCASRLVVCLLLLIHLSKLLHPNVASNKDVHIMNVESFRDVRPRPIAPGAKGLWQLLRVLWSLPRGCGICAGRAVAATQGTMILPVVAYARVRAMRTCTICARRAYELNYMDTVHRYGRCMIRQLLRCYSSIEDVVSLRGPKAPITGVFGSVTAKIKPRNTAEPVVFRFLQFGYQQTAD